jgi:hypothetical protein
MDFHYEELFQPDSVPEAYETLLHNALEGDPTLFTRSDGIEAAWRVIDAVLEAWQSEDAPPLVSYEPGSWGPAEADELLNSETAVAGGMGVGIDSGLAARLCHASRITINPAQSRRPDKPLLHRKQNNLIRLLRQKESLTGGYQRTTLIGIQLPTEGTGRQITRMDPPNPQITNIKIKMTAPTRYLVPVTKPILPFSQSCSL